MSTLRSGLAGPLVTVAVLTVSLAGADLALSVLAPVPDPFANLKDRTPLNQYVRSAFEPNLTLRTEAEPGLPGVEGTNVFSVNNMGFRGDSLVHPKPPDEFRVFLVGGSSAECLYLDDRDALNAVLQRTLQVTRPRGPTIKVYNAGKSGDRSDDHLSMVVHRIAHLQPDLVVVFAGINDLRAGIFGYDYLHFTARPSLRDREAGRLGLGSLVRLAAYEFQIPRRLFYLVKRVKPPTEADVLEAIPLRSNYRQAVEQRRAAPRATTPLRLDTAAYRRNLRSLIGAVRAQGASLVFMTQQTTWASAVDPRVDDWQWMTYGQGITYAAQDMDRALETLNDVMRGVSRDARAPLYDLARTLPKSLDFLYDDVHFNLNGAQTAGRGLAETILQAGLPPRRN